MKNDFAVLATFLDHASDEVEGRGLEEPVTEVRAKIRSFARGQLPERDRESLLHQLVRNPRWIERLAEEARKLRTPTPSRD